MPLGQLDRFHRLRQRANLIDLDQNAIAVPFSMPSLKTGVGHEQIVAHQLDLVAQLLGQLLPAFPVVLGKTVFDRDDRIRPPAPPGLAIARRIP